MEELVSDGWSAVSDVCAAQGGHLPRPNSEAEFLELIAIAEAQGANFIWLDAWLHDDGVWRWSDGSEVGFFLWDKGQPSGTDVDGTEERRLMIWRVEFGNHPEGWAYNDCRDDPAAFRPDEYDDSIAVICTFN